MDSLRAEPQAPKRSLQENGPNGAIFSRHLLALPSIAMALGAKLDVVAVTFLYLDGMAARVLADDDVVAVTVS